MKETIEQAAMQELNHSYATVIDGELVYQRNAMLNMFRKGSEWQAKQSPWISVEERLPEDGLIDPIAWNVTKSVVVVTSNGNAIVTKRRWNCTLKTWEWKGSHTFVNSIVKWMPIPE